MLLLERKLWKCITAIFFSSEPKKALKEARSLIAKTIGADSDEIFFTFCGSESDNWAIKMGAGKEGDILTTPIEHPAILNACKEMEQNGRNVKYLPVSTNGVAKIEELEKNVNRNTSLVSIMYANNEIGSIQPIKKAAKIVHAAGSVFHTDAVQAIGHVEIDVHDLDVDYLSASAHKFNGPKGIGFLYVKKGMDIRALINGGQQEFGKRAGTENVASIVAMSIALHNNVKRISTNSNKLMILEKRLISRLDNAGIDYIRNGSVKHVPGNVSLSFANFEGEVLLHRLDLKGICVSTGSACDSVNTQISHVIRAIRVPDKYAEGTIRISLGKWNTEQEVDYIADSVIEILKQ